MKKILFVDDEQFILNSLRRVLRKERSRWDISYANSGKEAIEILDKQEFDLLVTDMKMPGIDGMDVLMHAELRWPCMPRLALSGFSEKETHAKVTNLANQFLEKPCDTENLVKTIESCFGDN